MTRYLRYLFFRLRTAHCLRKSRTNYDLWLYRLRFVSDVELAAAAANRPPVIIIIIYFFYYATKAAQ